MTSKPTNRFVQTVKAVLRAGLGLGLLAWLLWQNRASLAQLQTQEIRWGYVALGLIITVAATLLTFVRWYLLVIAQDLPFRISDSFRLGFIGFAFNQIIPGAVSGDLAKVVMLVRQQERRAVAVATIIFDRIVGLYALVLLVGLAALVAWPKLRHVAELRELLVWVFIVSIVGTVGFILMFMPFFRGRWAEGLTRIPAVGGLIRELLQSIVVYQGKASVVIWTVVLSVVGHLGFVSSLYCIAAGLQGALWPWRTHYVVAPLGLMINAIPISPGGMGVGEYAMQKLFTSVGEDGTKAFLMMLVYRATSWAIALVGVAYLVLGSSDTRRAMADARAAEASLETPATDRTSTTDRQPI
jgi:uncharacterized protein (TIRG00374 family)